MSKRGIELFIHDNDALTARPHLKSIIRPDLYLCNRAIDETYFLNSISIHGCS